MRLINVHTLEPKEFFGAALPHYAILSHRWEQEEVTFQDLTSGKGKDMIGWKKIQGCCELAMDDNLEWAWIDSCCIDKTSSAELSEAINSMFRWYRDAEICYAYLSDVSAPLTKSDNMDAFRFSKWFTRGWTLQELLAPDELTFFDKDWKEIGTKEGLRETISKVTGIKHLFNFEDASVAQKMSWAARRETTRLEDQAYCLLGIFGVNMPPLYGEGPSAFLRLQLEIMRISNDESIFAWEDDSVTSSGLLAASPASFRYSNDVVWIASSLGSIIQRPPYSMTNKGLEISVELVEHTMGWKFPGIRWSGSSWAAPIHCRREGTLLSIVLGKVGAGSENYQRILCHTLPSYDFEAHANDDPRSKTSKVIYIRQPQINSGTRSYCYFRINSKPLWSYGWTLRSRHVLSSELGRWGSDISDCLQLKLSNSVATVQFQRERNAPHPNLPRFETFLIKLSCLGKNASIALITSNEPSHSSISEATIDGIMRTPDDYGYLSGFTREFKDFAVGETRTLRGAFPTRRMLLQASLWKEGGSGSRDIFAVELDEVLP
jgi:hypothetical protein